MTCVDGGTALGLAFGAFLVGGIAPTWGIYWFTRAFAEGLEEGGSS